MLEDICCDEDEVTEQKPSPPEIPQKEEEMTNGRHSNSVDSLAYVTRKTLDEASQHFFEIQKELIDHEVRVFSQKQAELDERFNKTIKDILAENTTQFLNGLKSIYNRIENSD